jgi:hypothetical protein
MDVMEATTDTTKDGPAAGGSSVDNPLATIDDAEQQVPAIPASDDVDDDQEVPQATGCTVWRAAVFLYYLVGVGALIYLVCYLIVADFFLISSGDVFTTGFIGDQTTGFDDGGIHTAAYISLGTTCLGTLAFGVYSARATYRGGTYRAIVLVQANAIWRTHIASMLLLLVFAGTVLQVLALRQDFALRRNGSKIWATVWAVLISAILYGIVFVSEASLTPHGQPAVRSATERWLVVAHVFGTYFFLLPIFFLLWIPSGPLLWGTWAALNVANAMGAHCLGFSLQAGTFNMTRPWQCFEVVSQSSEVYRSADTPDDGSKPSSQCKAMMSHLKSPVSMRRWVFVGSLVLISFSVFGPLPGASRTLFMGMALGGMIYGSALGADPRTMATKEFMVGVAKSLVVLGGSNGHKLQVSGVMDAALKTAPVDLEEDPEQRKPEAENSELGAEHGPATCLNAMVIVCMAFFLAATTLATQAGMVNVVSRDSHSPGPTLEIVIGNPVNCTNFGLEDLGYGKETPDWTDRSCKWNDEIWFAARPPCIEAQIDPQKYMECEDERAADYLKEQTKLFEAANYTQPRKQRSHIKSHTETHSQIGAEAVLGGEPLTFSPTGFFFDGLHRVAMHFPSIRLAANENISRATLRFESSSYATDLGATGLDQDLQKTRIMVRENAYAHAFESAVPDQGGVLSFDAIGVHDETWYCPEDFAYTPEMPTCGAEYHFIDGYHERDIRGRDDPWIAIDELKDGWFRGLSIAIDNGTITTGGKPIGLCNAEQCTIWRCRCSEALAMDVRVEDSAYSAPLSLGEVEDIGSRKLSQRSHVEWEVPWSQGVTRSQCNVVIGQCDDVEWEVPWSQGVNNTSDVQKGAVEDFQNQWAGFI